jgi:hypothetical protein
LGAVTAAERFISSGNALAIVNRAITVLVSAILVCHGFVNLLSQSDTSRVEEKYLPGKPSDRLPVLLSLGRLELVAQPIQTGLVAVLTYFRKHLVFLFRHMVFHIFDQLFERRAKLFVIRIEALNFFEQRFYFLMLFQGFLDHVFQVSDFLHLGIEDRFLDMRMNIQFRVDLVEQFLPLFGVFGIIYLVEQTLDRLMVLLK